ncbi:MAG: MBL fold metallo-hydrolase [Geminicoccaceae bacterium]
MSNPSQSLLSRRLVLGGGAALGLAASLPVRPAGATAPLAQAQAPGFYRVAVGRIEVTALLDGHLELPPALFDLPEPVAAELLKSAFRPAGPIVTSVNAFAVNTGDRLYLVDTGTVQGYAPTLAHLPEALAAAGLAPEAVDTILLTHLHPDHAGGLVRDGKLAFPNAELVVAESEAGFWLDAATASRAPTEVQPMFKLAQGNIVAYGERVRRLPAAGGPVVPGIEAIALPGHTPGHTGFLISDGDAALWIWGDIVHAAALQFPRPEATLSFDVDRPLAAATRKRAFDRAAADRLAVAGAHLPFPGIGHVTRTADGQGFGFVPAPWQPISG